MLKNSFKKLAVLSLLGILGITGCSSSDDDIYAKPGNYNDPIVVIDGNKDIHNDILSIIYDAIHEGSLSSNVLDKSLYNFAESVFGTYNSLTRKKGSNEITLKVAAADITSEECAKFIRAHKAYWTYNDDGEHIDDNGQVVTDENFNPSPSERQLVASRWDAIDNRICEAMYSRALGGTYTEKNLFREIKFIRSLYEAGQKVDYETAKDDGIDPIFVPYTVEKQDIFKPVEIEPGVNVCYLNREYYQSSALTDGDDYSSIEIDARYIEDEIIPEIYNDLLIEQYLLDESVQSIRNARARKINVLKIEKYSSFTNNADMLVKALVDEIYSTTPSKTDSYVETDAEKIESAGKALFEKYGMIAKGLYDDINKTDASVPGTAAYIVKNLHAQASDVYKEKTIECASKVDPSTGNPLKITYYENTTYGDLVKEFDKIDKVTKWADMDESLYSSYTSSGTTTIYEGFYQKAVDIKQQQNITKGWYIKDKSASLDANGTINDRLFALSVANAKREVGKTEQGQFIDEEEVKQLTKEDRLEKDSATGEWKVKEKWGYYESNNGPEESFIKENSFLCSINGTYYLKFDGQYVGDDKRNDIVYDDGSAYYIVQVLEAAKDSKLRSAKDSDVSYAKTRGKDFLNEVIDEIAKVLGETGNYASVSKDYWLKKMDIKYHDTTVYEYFEDNYPDLFDD